MTGRPASRRTRRRLRRIDQAARCERRSTDLNATKSANSSMTSLVQFRSERRGPVGERAGDIRRASRKSVTVSEARLYVSTARRLARFIESATCPRNSAPRRGARKSAPTAPIAMPHIRPVRNLLLDSFGIVVLKRCPLQPPRQSAVPALNDPIVMPRATSDRFRSTGLCLAPDRPGEFMCNSGIRNVRFAVFLSASMIAACGSGARRRRKPHRQRRKGRRDPRRDEPTRRLRIGSSIGSRPTPA